MAVKLDLAGLNPPQREAVLTKSGPLLVLAGAGTGKTRVVTYRVAELIRGRIAPDRILCVTFTNKAASEMRQRADGLVGKPKRARKCEDRPTPEISTFHSLCLKILRRHITKLGYPAAFSICDPGDQDSIARGALREIRAPQDSLRSGDLLYFISQWKSKAIRPQQASSHAESDKEHLAAIAFKRYQDALRARGAVDFDDLLLLVEELFRTHVAVRREEAARFDHIMIDEYQDTNETQYKIIKALAAGHRNLCVVGDDDQSIYGWRGAEVEHILRFAKDWPDAKVVRLEDNYRSTEAIIGLSNTLIQFNKTRHDKVLRAAKKGGARPRILQFNDENLEAEQVVGDIKRILDAKEAKPKDIAILCRTNEQPRPFETVLRQAKIPYVLIGSSSFFDRKEIKDLLAYLKLVTNPDDEASLLRILNTPPRGIGRAAQKQLIAAAVSSGKSAWHILENGIAQSGIASKSLPAFELFRELILDFKVASEKRKLPDFIQYVLEKSNYDDELRRCYSEPLDRETRASAIEELIQTAAAFERKGKSNSLGAFLNDLALGLKDENDKEEQLEQNAVVLMTLHSAKGLEFPHVYLVGLEEGILPHKRTLEEGDQQIEEERRLCYVGVTRAQDRLTLSLSLSRKKWGKPRETMPSRFLFEMTGQAENWQILRDKKMKEAREKSFGRTGTKHSKGRKAGKK